MVTVAVGVITTIINLVKSGVKSAQDYYNELSGIRDKVSDLNGQYKTNSERLKEIEGLQGTADFTPTLQEEYELLQKQNEELRLQIQYYNARADVTGQSLAEATEKELRQDRQYAADGQTGLQHWMAVSGGLQAGIAYDMLSFTAEEVVENAAKSLEALSQQKLALDPTSNTYVADLEKLNQLYAAVLEHVEDARSKIENGIENVGAGAKDELQAVLDRLYEASEAYQKTANDVVGAFSAEVSDTLPTSASEVKQRVDSAIAALEDAQQEVIQRQEYLNAATDSAIRDYRQSLLDQAQARYDAAEAELKAADAWQRLQSYTPEDIGEIFGSFESFQRGAISIGEVNEQLNRLYEIFLLLRDLDPETYTYDWWNRIKAASGVPDNYNEGLDTIYKYLNTGAYGSDTGRTRNRRMYEAKETAKMLSGDEWDDFLAWLIKTDKEFASGADAVAEFRSEVVEANKTVGKAASVDTLSDIKDGISALNEAFKDMKADGEVGFDTIEKIQKVFNDEKSGFKVDGLEEYIARLVAVRDDASAVTDVLNEMAEALLAERVASGDLAESDENLIAAMLKEAGVLNAEQMAHAIVTQAKLDQIAATHNFEEMTEDEIAALYAEALAGESAAASILALQAKKVLANAATIKTDGDIKNLSALAKQLQITGDVLLDFNRIVGQIAKNNNLIDVYNLEIAKAGATSQVNNIRRTLISQLETQNSDLAEQLGRIFDDAMAKVPQYTFGGNVTNTNSGSKTEKTLAEQIKEQFDLVRTTIEHGITMIGNELDAGMPEDEIRAYRSRVLQSVSDIGTGINQALSSQGLEPIDWQKILYSHFENASDNLLDGADETLSALRQKMDDAAEHYNALINGNLDYRNRPVVSAEQMWAAGWNDFDGDYATTYSSALTEGNFTISITPILDNGEILSPEALDEYIRNLATDGSAEELLASDPLKLIIDYQLGDYDPEWWEAHEEALQEWKDAHLDAWDEIQEYPATAVANNLSNLKQGSAQYYQILMDMYHQEVLVLEKYQALHPEEDLSETIMFTREAWWEAALAAVESYKTEFEDESTAIQNEYDLLEHQRQELLRTNDVDGANRVADEQVALLEKRMNLAHYWADEVRTLLASLGYSEEQIEQIVRELGFPESWWSDHETALDKTKEKIEALTDVVDDLKDKLSDLTEVHSTLVSAMREYNENGFLSPNSLNTILSLEPKYLALLKDEAGQFSINEEAIQRLIAAKNEDIAIETSRVYLQRIINVLIGESEEKLDDLVLAMDASTDANWSQVNSMLALIQSYVVSGEISQAYYDQIEASIRNIRNLTNLTNSTLSRWDKSQHNGYLSQKDAVQQLFDLVQEMVKWELDQQVDALEQEKTAYGEIIDQQKEKLKNLKSEQDYQKKISDKLKEMAKLQNRINTLSLDDSRDAQAERTKLLEELNSLQEDLYESQRDEAIERQEEALDQQLADYNDTKDKEIKALKETLDSTQELYDATLNRVQSAWDSGWDEFYSGLLEEQTTPFVQKCA